MNSTEGITLCDRRDQQAGVLFQRRRFQPLHGAPLEITRELSSKQSHIRFSIRWGGQVQLDQHVVC